MSTSESRRDGSYEVEVLGVDIFNPNSGEQQSSSKVEEDVACWFIDDDYNDTSFFVRQAYFLGGKDPYQKLKTALKAEIDEGAWSVLHSATSHPFDAPSTGKIAIKVINHFGDEVMKVLRHPRRTGGEMKDDGFYERLRKERGDDGDLSQLVTHTVEGLVFSGH